ncbi:flagellar M-ring protein FliF [Neoasaia chiangmaiensis NBRC 101099]|uniref:Flagellar M-ring protein n=1 Tax=Neoasaia chiangmaiensis TaxID=320497 RepID=A0A1U9KTC0_9PROT|nr:flagellar basal-body MS-ring/collar protein FliF [Neoasaia chiangmaiensis]AQS88930.1 hypothetical protein A0U93_14515 [Neoasaia chiangmaiensis]GBR40373.1 flagellar M-ring protein FliF [Neoasaia chiangmaiensis NBRC 101099]GEN13930.1 flagellar M-ring protein [Neoasaia chiangmaiensis]
MNNIINNIRSLGLNKLVAIGVVLLGLILSLSFLAIDTESKKVILYENLETKDVEGITEHLSKNHIPYNLSNDAKTVFVAPTDVPNARLILAKQNLPNSGSLGYELFDKEDGFSATQFKQKINEKRALEGELERSIRLIQGIIGVRVHIVIPDREMFSSVRQSAQASILIQTSPSRIDDESVNAIANLVKAAIPELSREQIEIIDSSGHVLYDNGKYKINSDLEKDQASKMEDDIASKVETILSPIFGSDHLRVKANVLLDFDKVVKSYQDFNPEKQVLRSQKIKTEKSNNLEKTQNVSASNNLPNKDEDGGRKGNISEGNEETDNYEIGTETIKLEHTAPSISRITVSVLIDGNLYSFPKENKKSPQWTDGNIGQIDSLVKATIGYDSKRGDLVVVKSMNFSNENKFSDGDMQVRHEWISIVYNNKNLVFLVCLVLFLLFCAKQIFKSKGGNVKLSHQKELGISTEKSMHIHKDKNIIAEKESQLPLLTYGKEVAISTENVPNNLGAMVVMEGIDGQIKSSSIQQVAKKIEEYPEESISLIKSWLSSEPLQES